MIYQRRCPHCRGRITVVVRQPPPMACTVETSVVRRPDAPEQTIPLSERIEKLLRRAGKAGLTVRELQQRLQGPKAEEIRAVLDAWVSAATPPDYDDAPVAAVPCKYGVIVYIWRQSEEETETVDQGAVAATNATQEIE